MNFNQQYGSSSFSSPIEEDVKPNIQSIQRDVISRSGNPQDSFDVKPTPPDFSQYYNHKILLSKSFDCKTGMTQVGHQPNVRNGINSTVEPSSINLPNNYNTPLSNNINNSANYFEICQRGPPVPRVPFIQRTLSQNSHRQEPRVLRNHQIYPSTSTQNSNHQSESTTHAFSENFHSVPESPSTQFLHIPKKELHSPSPVPHEVETHYNSPVMLPPLHLPPPSFSSGSSSSEMPFYAQNSSISNSYSKSSTNGYSENVSQNRSRRVHHSYVPPTSNFFSNNLTRTNIPPCTQNSLDFVSTPERTTNVKCIPQNRTSQEYAPFTGGHPSTSTTQFYAQNSLDSKSNLRSTINGYSKCFPDMEPNRVHSKLNIPATNFFRNNPSSLNESIHGHTVKSESPCIDSNCTVPFNVSVPPPAFSVPPPIPSILHPSCPISSLSHVKSETPDDDSIIKSNSIDTTNCNHQMHNGIGNTLLSSNNLKTPRSTSRSDCDYYRSNNVSNTFDSSSNFGIGKLKFATNIFKNVSSSFERYNRPSHSRSRSREKYPENSTRRSSSRTRRSSSRSRRSSRQRRSSSRTKCSSNRNRRSSSGTRRSSSRSRHSSRRTRRSSSRNRRSSSRNRRSSSRSKHSSRTIRHSSGRRRRSSSIARHSSSRTSPFSKRFRDRSIEQSQSKSESKRLCTRRSRSKSFDDKSGHSKYRRSSSRSRNNYESKTSSLRSDQDSKQRNDSKSKLKPKPTDAHPRTRDNSKTKNTSAEAEDNVSDLDRWRMNNCRSEREMTEKFSSLATMEADQIIEEEKKIWTRSAPADLHYIKRTEDNSYECTEKTKTICNEFKSVIQSFVSAKELKAPFDYTANRKKIRRKCLHCKTNGSISSDSESSENSDEENAEEENWLLELQLKQNHPDRLHPELWFNDKGEMNDGPVCRCSTKSRRSGIRHNIYAGEEKQEYCNPNTNNVDKLYHYRVTVSPPTNFLINKPTVIEHDNHEFIFEGFSLFSHHPLKKLPTCRVIRFNIQYTIVYIEEKVPEGFSVGETELFFKYLFHEVLELVDLDLKSANNKDGCPQFHIMPRFVRELKDNGKELLPMYRVIEFFTSSFVPVISEEFAKGKDKLSTYDWQDFADDVKGMIIVKPGAKPCAMRVDQLDRDSESKDIYPDAVHFGSRPLQLCFAGSPDFQKLWKSYVKLRHLVANKPKRTDEDKRRLASKEQKLQEMRTNSKMKRGVTVAISCRDFYRTGIMCDMVQHAMLIPVLICHLRFHHSLNILEERIAYKFKNRYLLQLALTHPSYRENFGTNPDHARNSLSNCGVRQPEYGDRKIHFQNTRKRGINTLINIMSKLGRKVATESNITHNERLEFLGDAVVEFITSIHLFHVFPDIEEGGLATYRAAIVQNQHLAHLAKKLGLEEFMLYAHGSDLCHEVELKHAMANCFEALMGALFLDGGIHIVDKVFSRVLHKDDEEKFDIWMNYPKHPLQEQEPNGDRQWVDHSPLLKKLQYLEYSTGIVFYHIRLLARVFTTRSMGYTNLTLGSNQRLEFLGDTVLQLITSDYLYNHFPEHHEGHLSLLRSSLVNNRTQSVVCNDIGMPFFANLINPKIELKMKDRADLLEALLGAMYIDKGMKACEQFCKVCFFPRLQYFILNQEWNDPKSKLQQCCLTLRTLDGGEPDIPIYKVIEHVGPTNSRSYTVAVYFKHERLAKATGNSIQQAEMNAAKVALEKCPSICPQLDHQRRVIAKSLELQKHDGVVLDILTS